MTEIDHDDLVKSFTTIIMRFPDEIPVLALDIVKQLNAQHKRLEKELDETGVDDDVQTKLLTAAGLINAMLRVIEAVVTHKHLLSQIKAEIYTTLAYGLSFGS
jgi:hypothetical protein